MNFNALQNLTPLTINTTNITSTQELIPVLIETSNNVSEGYLGLAIMSGVFIVLLFSLFRDDGDIRLDITRSLMKSSGFVSILGIIMLVTGIIASFVHVMWFIIIFIITIISTFMLKKKGL